MSKLKLIAGWMAMLYLCFQSVASWGGDLPRMWEVTGKAANGKEVKFHVLGVTHDGMDAEYDDYFYKKVMPVFERADILFAETAFLFSMNVPDCKVPLPDTKEVRETIAAARKLVVERTIAYPMLRVTVENPTKEITEKLKKAARELTEKKVNSLSEYGLIMAMKEAQIQKWNILGGFDQPGFRPMIAVQLTRLGKPTLKTESIDSPQDLVDAYCDQGKGRLQYFQGELAASDPEALGSLHPHLKKVSEPEFVESVRKYRLSQYFMGLFPSYDSYRSIVCARNRKWFEAVTKSNFSEGARFYALGLGHLIPPTVDDPLCPTFLALLQQAGMNVKLVK